MTPSSEVDTCSSTNKVLGMFTRFDANHDGKLDVPEFVPLAYEVSKKPINTAEQIFRVGSGFQQV